MAAIGHQRSGQSCSSSTAYPSLSYGPHRRLPRTLPRLPRHPRHRHRHHRRHLLPPRRCRRRRFSRRRHLLHGWRRTSARSTCRRCFLWRLGMCCCVACLVRCLCSRRPRHQAAGRARKVSAKELAALELLRPRPTRRRGGDPAIVSDDDDEHQAILPERPCRLIGSPLPPRVSTRPGQRAVGATDGAGDRLRDTFKL